MLCYSRSADLLCLHVRCLLQVHQLALTRCMLGQCAHLWLLCCWCSVLRNVLALLSCCVRIACYSVFFISLLHRGAHLVLLLTVMCCNSVPPVLFTGLLPPCIKESVSCAMPDLGWNVVLNLLSCCALVSLAGLLLPWGALGPHGLVRCCCHPHCQHCHAAGRRYGR
jgi:hypothetical protein